MRVQGLLPPLCLAFSTSLECSEVDVAVELEMRPVGQSTGASNIGGIHSVGAWEGVRVDVVGLFGEETRVNDVGVLSWEMCVDRIIVLCDCCVSSLVAVFFFDVQPIILQMLVHPTTRLGQSAERKGGWVSWLNDQWP